MESWKWLHLLCKEGMSLPLLWYKSMQREHNKNQSRESRRWGRGTNESNAMKSILFSSNLKHWFQNIKFNKMTCQMCVSGHKRCFMSLVIYSKGILWKRLKPMCSMISVCCCASWRLPKCSVTEGTVLQILAHQWTKLQAAVFMIINSESLWYRNRITLLSYRRLRNSVYSVKTKQVHAVPKEKSKKQVYLEFKFTSEQDSSFSSCYNF